MEHSKRGADVLVEPKVGAVAMLDFTQKKRCMQAGTVDGQAAVRRIRKAIAA